MTSATRKHAINRLLISGLLAGVLIDAFAQDSGFSNTRSADHACVDLARKSVTWHPAAWPSDEFIRRTGINYVGKCDRMIIDTAHGEVTAWLLNTSSAERVRCKYELAGLAELSHRTRDLQRTAASVAASCKDVAQNDSDADLVRSWRLAEEMASDRSRHSPSN